MPRLKSTLIIKRRIKFNRRHLLLLILILFWGISLLGIKWLKLFSIFSRNGMSYSRLKVQLKVWLRFHKNMFRVKCWERRPERKGINLIRRLLWRKRREEHTINFWKKGIFIKCIIKEFSKRRRSLIWSYKNLEVNIW